MVAPSKMEVIYAALGGTLHHRNHPLSPRFYAGLPLSFGKTQPTLAPPPLQPVSPHPLLSPSALVASSTIDSTDGQRNPPRRAWAKGIPTSPLGPPPFDRPSNPPTLRAHHPRPTSLRVIIVPFRGVFPNSYPISLLAFQFMPADRFVRRAPAPPGSQD